MVKPQTAKGAWRKFFRIAVYMLGSLLLLILLAIFALTLPPVQQRITREAQSFLQEKLQTRVEIASIGLRFPYFIALKWTSCPWLDPSPFYISVLLNR